MIRLRTPYHKIFIPDNEELIRSSALNRPEFESIESAMEFIDGLRNQSDGEFYFPFYFKCPEGIRVAIK